MPDSIVGRRLFTDGEQRDVYRDELAGSQYVHDGDALLARSSFLLSFSLLF